MASLSGLGFGFAFGLGFVFEVVLKRAFNVVYVLLRAGAERTVDCVCEILWGCERLMFRQVLSMCGVVVKVFKERKFANLAYQ